MGEPMSPLRTSRHFAAAHNLVACAANRTLSHADRAGFLSTLTRCISFRRDGGWTYRQSLVNDRSERRVFMLIVSPAGRRSAAGQDALETTKKMPGQD